MIESPNHSEQVTVLEQIHTATAEHSGSASHCCASLPLMPTSDRGQFQGDINSYLRPDTAIQPNTSDQLPSLLLPSANNIKNLQKRVSEQFKKLLQDHGIALAPEKICFVGAAKIQLPQKYAHARALRRALDQNQRIRLELSSLNALSSHYLDMRIRTPFGEAMNNAATQEEIDGVISQYRFLLRDDNSYISTALAFSPAGDVLITADGAAVNFV